MKFSIVIPLYNKQESIRRAIVSACDQQDIEPPEVEIVIVDDGSKDGSRTIAKAVTQEFPDRNIRLISQSNAGVSAARNRGVIESQGDYICFLDSDDTYRPGFLKEVSNLIDEFPNATLYATSYAFVCSAKGEIKPARPAPTSTPQTRRLIDNFFLEAATSDLPFCASSVCVPKRVFTDLGGFPEAENMGEDQDFYIKAALNGAIAHSKLACSNYYIDVNDSLMDSISPDAEMPYSQRLQTRLDNGQIPQKYQHGAQLMIAGHLTDLARRNIRSQSFETAKRLLQDRRSRKRPLKWLYWQLRIKLAEFYV